MAAPTGISLSLDLEEYSRFEIREDRATITVFITASGGGDMSGEQITIELIKGRRLRDQVVHTTTHTLVGTSDPVQESLTIYLPDVRDTTDSISLIRRGFFFVRATSVTTPAVTGDSVDVPISILTAEMLRETYLFGLNLQASDVRDVRTQPINITGVEVIEVNSSHQTGFDVLTYIYNDSTGSGGSLVQQLAWGGGGSAVTLTGPGRYLLRRDCHASDYIVVQIRNMSALPTTPQKDELLVDKDFITDNMLRRWIDQACDWLENDKIAGVFLEPTRIVTDPILPGNVVPDWDFIVPQITFYPVNPVRWIDILFPYPGLLKIDELFGQVADTRIVDIDLSWVEISERNGFVQLVPFNQEVAFNFIGLVWVESLRGRIELPNFWHFDAVAGLREVDPVLQEIIGKKAAIDALTVAGHAFRGGFASQSVSRDGVSESVSYTASAIYGIYSATIEDYNKFLNREIKQVKGRYRGVNMVVL
jgi:hypothetical protein